jgi:hypothetical protein
LRQQTGNLTVTPCVVMPEFRSQQRAAASVLPEASWAQRAQRCSVAGVDAGRVTLGADLGLADGLDSAWMRDYRACKRAVEGAGSSSG